MDQESVLIVEDRQDIRELLRCHVEDLGFRIYEADSGYEAIALLQTIRIKLLLSDYEMGGGSGLWLLEQCSVLGRPLSTVFLTAKADHVAKRLISKGAEAVFGKPWNRHKLANLVSGILTPCSAGYSLREYRPLTDIPCAVPGLSHHYLHILNLSLDGAFIGVTDAIPPEIGTLINLNIMKHSALSFSAKVVVRWHTRPKGQSQQGFGVSFLKSGREDRNIANLVNFMKTGEDLVY